LNFRLQKIYQIRKFFDVGDIPNVNGNDKAAFGSDKLSSNVTTP
jgi:hypothetical protein